VPLCLCRPVIWRQTTSPQAAISDFFLRKGAFSGSQGGYDQILLRGGLTDAFPNCTIYGSWSEGGEKLASFSVELFPGQKMDGCALRIRTRAAGNRGDVCVYMKIIWPNEIIREKNSGKRGEGRYKGKKNFQI